MLPRAGLARSHRSP